MYIEDIVETLCGVTFWLVSEPDPTSTFDPNDYEVLYNLSYQTMTGVGYTEKQRFLVIKLLSKYPQELIKNKIDPKDLNEPQYKLPLRVLSSAKSVTIEDITETGSTPQIIVRFPYNEALVSEIKRYKDKHNDSVWFDYDKKTWVFALYEEHLRFIKKFVNLGYETDDRIQEYLKEIEEIENNFENYIPTLDYKDGKFYFKNVLNSVPQPTSSDLIEVMVQAKQCGISVWDEAIDIALKEFNPNIAEIFNPPVSSRRPTFNDGLNSLIDIIQYNKNILIVIPGGSELDHLKYTHQFLSANGHDNKHMSVMFRLDSSSGRMCNEYIREHSLNNPLGEETKFVFVSSKIPKPIIESNKEFDLVIHYGTNSAHYTLKNYVKQHYNVVNVIAPL